MDKPTNEQRIQAATLSSVRNEGLDLLKCICAFLVVTVHCPMIPGLTGEVITAVNRIAVPVFFMITGWFYEKIVARGREKRQILKILKLIIWSSLFYFVFNGLISAVNNELSDYLRSYMSLKAIFKFFVLTASPFQGHLWYLSALLYVLIIVRWFGIRFDKKKLYWLIPILLLGDLVLGKYSLLLLGRPVPTSLVRNWLFVGLPYFLLGDCLNRNQEKLQNILQMKKRWLVILFAFFVATTILEESFLASRGLSAERNHYISSTFLSLTAFMAALNQNADISNGGLRWLAQIGRRYSAMIYIIHPAILALMLLIIEKTFSDPETAMDIFRWIAPFLVFFAALGYAVCHEKVSAFIARRAE